jgi:Fe-S cluster assembly protein SufB
VPDEIKNTFDKLGIPEAEKEVLAGVKAQYDSEVVYGSLKEQWEKDGVVFLSMDEALVKHPEMVREYFSKTIAATDNKFAALNTAGYTLDHKDEKKDVEIGAVIWVRFHEWRQK